MNSRNWSLFIYEYFCNPWPTSSKWDKIGKTSVVMMYGFTAVLGRPISHSKISLQWQQDWGKSQNRNRFGGLAIIMKNTKKGWWVGDLCISISVRTELCPILFLSLWPGHISPVLYQHFETALELFSVCLGASTQFWKTWIMNRRKKNEEMLVLKSALYFTRHSAKIIKSECLSKYKLIYDCKSSILRHQRISGLLYLQQK